MSDMLKIMGLFVVVGAIVYLATNWPKPNKRKFAEGFTSGVAGTAANYATKVHSNATVLLDKLLISKYRPDYEKVILNYDDYINALMLDTLLSIDADTPDSVAKGLDKINSLNKSKDALNNILTFVDKS